MFHAIINTSLKHRLLVLAIALLLLIYGGFSLTQVPVDVFPDLNKPTVSVWTEAHGMAPEEVEQLVTSPIETAMTGLTDVANVRSVSGIGLSLVAVEFGWDTDTRFNREQVAQRLASLQGQLPAGIVPEMGPVSSIMGEIMLIAMHSKTATPMQVREAADWVVRPRLLSVPGVTQVIPIGGEIKQYQVIPNMTMLNAFEVSLENLEAALQGFSTNSSGGFLERKGQQLLIRTIGQTTGIDDLRGLTVGYHEGHPVLLEQVAKVVTSAREKRGDAGFMGAPAVILSVQKQPGADTLKVTRGVEVALAELNKTLPAGISAGDILFKQADFIENSIDNVAEALRDGAIIVAVVLFLFLLNVRTTLISLLAIPVSLLITVLVFRYFNLSINTMTLGGLAIAIGELVDDAVVGVENVLRRLKQNAASAVQQPVIEVIANATLEVRSGIVYATFIIVLVFVPLFALTNIEGRLFAPLGVAYIVSILISMIVAITLTPVLCYYLLPRMKLLSRGDSPLMRALKAGDRRVLEWSFGHARLLLAGTLLTVLIAAAAVPFFPRTFLPAFNEGTLTVNMLMNPDVSLAQSDRIGALAEQLILQVPEVTQVGRRTGRAELDEHASGVHLSEIDVGLKPSERDKQAVLTEIRSRLALLPITIYISQPISHRLDHLLSGVSAPIALKIYGADLDRLTTLAATARERLADIPGLRDLQIEKQALIPQLRIAVDYARAREYGVTPAAVNEALETLVSGKDIAQLSENERRFDVVLRLADSERKPQALSGLLVETPGGPVPLKFIADISEDTGPNQISHEDKRRRIVLYATTDGSNMTDIITAVRARLAAAPLPAGYTYSLEGQFQAQEEATRLISGLALLSLALIFLVLYSRYRSLTLTLIILGNIPLALVGSVIALAITDTPLSLASMVGFITLAGISARNGILKISHYIHLVADEGEAFGKQMIVRGSLERLTPVLMTALVAAFALTPLMLSAGEPGKEILAPVALVIFGGLISSTLLDTLLTPVMFYLWGEKPLRRLLAQRDAGEIGQQLA